MKTIAIYPGTFDPITNGHSDIVSRAARLFDRIVVAVAKSTGKQTLFSIEERIELATTALKGMANVEVRGFTGLVTEYAKHEKANVIIRGLRAVSDFEYEFQMAGMNRQLNDRVETIFLTPSEHLNYISSSLVREIAGLEGDVSRFVHAKVVRALQRKFGK
ncbi:MAG: pantetheine-phosphate adenylyltransferase [Gammaproteobacteria bacterium RIFCSPLOWO2_02_FULL_56_15]|nr:MAG: pantetheine-phosphate adenylyltransferase [Gammaproteobacteria bacterium RIFCSPLOWO2_02_FULL_56_15]